MSLSSNIPNVVQSVALHTTLSSFVGDLSSRLSLLQGTRAKLKSFFWKKGGKVGGFMTQLADFITKLSYNNELLRK